MVFVNPTIPPWLSNSINKKRKLQPISTLVMDIMTKYADHGSKMKKLNIDAHLTIDPITEKITVEVATYRKNIESGDINAEDLKVTSVEL